MPKLSPNAQQARRDHILDSAERCFIEKGFHAATMHDICRKAEVSPGALYGYFTSKEDLIAGLCEREKNRFANELAMLSEAPDFLAALNSMADHYCCQEPIEKVRLHIEISAEGARNEAIGHTLRAMQRMVRASFIELLEREKSKGRISPTLPIETIVRAMSALGDGLFFNRAIDPSLDPRSIVPAMMTMISALLHASETPR